MAAKTLKEIIDKRNFRTAAEKMAFAFGRNTAIDTMQAQNTGSPKLPPCACCEKRASLGYYLENGYNFCPFCGRQLRAGA